MPTIFLNRPRHHEIISGKGEELEGYLWERANAICYEFGGFLMVIGGIFTFPNFIPAKFLTYGLCFKLAGTCCYMLVNLQAALQVRLYKKERDATMRLFFNDDDSKNTTTTTDRDDRDDEYHYVNLDCISTYLYLSGSILFAAGSTMLFPYLQQQYPSYYSGWCYVIGSIAFILGACCNVMQIVREETMLELQLMNLTAILFITGSTIFAMASIPSVWSATTTMAQSQLVELFVAWSCEFASILFLLGGATNYWKASIVAQKHLYLKLQRNNDEKEGDADTCTTSSIGTSLTGSQPSPPSYGSSLSTSTSEIFQKV